MAEMKEALESAEKAKLPDWWAVPKSSKVVGYRIPIDAHNVARASSGNTSTIVLPEELVGKVVAWSATMSIRRGVDWVPIETLGSHLDTIGAEESGGRSQELRVLWRANPDVADTEPEKDGLACSLLLAVR
ncbi:MAG: hypothetical protein V1912_06880 [bacterium]